MTTSIQFYHLLHTSLPDALAKLLQKILAQNSRALILVDDERAAKTLSDALWQQSELLPHGTASNPTHAEHQPIYITWNEENPNQSDILVTTHNVIPVMRDSFTKLLDIFDGRDEEMLAAARFRWSAYKDAGAQLQYIKQQLTGGWKIEV